jgi:hypothetical protein
MKKLTISVFLFVVILIIIAEIRKTSLMATNNDFTVVYNDTLLYFLAFNK